MKGPHGARETTLTAEPEERLHALDAVRAFALLLGIFYHAAISFIPIVKIWVIADNSPSIPLAIFVLLTHLFRMSLFFFIAGFFAHLVYHRKGAQAFARDRFKRILLPFIVGWCVMAPLLGLIWRWGIRKSGIVPSNYMFGPDAHWSIENIPLTHLWFLYYLVLIYVLIVGTRHVLIDRIDANGGIRCRMDRALRKMLDRRWAPVVLSLPLAMTGLFTPDWNESFGMPTPDHSLIPEMIPLVGYSVAFMVGWMFHRDPGLLQLLTSRVKSSLWLCLPMMLLDAASGYLLNAQPTLFPSFFRFIAALAATMLTWYFNFALVGFALKRFARPSPRTRYVADASYWFYIIHLPIVCALQVGVAYWSIHWTLKYPLIVSITFAILFLSYRYLVRFTFIGAVLNGRKYRLPPLRAQTA
jgi:glucan biosynthesis protein C